MENVIAAKNKILKRQGYINVNIPVVIIISNYYQVKI
jgi:hypothetical protein